LDRLVRSIEFLDHEAFNNQLSARTLFACLPVCLVSTLGRH
jgi:hypothetical protein